MKRPGRWHRLNGRQRLDELLPLYQAGMTLDAIAKHFGVNRKGIDRFLSHLRAEGDERFAPRDKWRQANRTKASRPITIDGVTYPSKSAARAALGIGQHRLNCLILGQAVDDPLAVGKTRWAEALAGKKYKDAPAALLRAERMRNAGVRGPGSGLSMTRGASSIAGCG